MINPSISLSLAIAIPLLVGCSSTTSTADETPFRDAIAQYTQANNMAMKIKEIKKGPTIDGSTATLQASMTHEQLAGPSVTWDFQFAKQPDGRWTVSNSPGKGG